MRKHWRWAGIGLGVLAACGLAWALDAWMARWDLDRAGRDLAAGRFAAARQRLAQRAASWSGRGRDEALFLLGLCEQAEGRLDEADDAWARIPGGSRFALRASIRRAELALDRGRFAAAEGALEPALRAAEPGLEADEARRLLGRLWRYEGRLDDVRLLLREGLDGAEDPAAVLVELAHLDTEPVPVEGVRQVLDRAERLAPGDDRVWLGRAYLAIRTGQIAEAGRWLDACERLRPRDPAVGRARLEAARAADAPAEALRALPMLPADRFAPAEVLALRAWFAALAGDEDAEQAALTELLDRDPGNARALERLAERSARDGDPERAAQLRRRKDALDRARQRYRSLLADPSAPRDATELALLAEALSRRSEARGWALQAERSEPDPSEARQILARLDHSEPDRPAPGTTLADLISTPSRSGPSPSEEAADHPLAFVDDAEAAGLRFVFDSGRSPLRQLPETMSGGVALLDYDGNGWLDVFAIQGGPFPSDSGRDHPGDRLFRNRGGGTFEDATDSSGLADLPRGYGHGVAVGDFDNDGHPDLFVTRWRSYALLRNRGDGRFEDVTAVAGLGGDRDWPTSAAWADLDADGDLDLFVCHYLAWDADHPRICRDPETGAIRSCDPRLFPALPDHVFRNDGGRFVDATAAAGIVDPDGRGLGVVAADLDGDGRVDLYVANDQTANELWRNLGGFRFEPMGLVSGTASNADGGYRAGMGIACGDLDGDGRTDLAVTNFYGEGMTFYRNLGAGLFADRTEAIGLAAPTRFLLGFGVAFLDADNDGRLDLASANGHVNDARPIFAYAMPAQLLRGGAGGRLTDVSDRAGPPWAIPRVGRGLAVGDLDNDGRLDLVIVSQDGPLAFFRNRTAGGHSVTFLLEGTACARDAVAARVTITAGGRRQEAQRLGGGSYQSASDPRLHFGLGTATMVEAVEVAWPSGRVDRYRDLPADSGYRLREGDAEPRRSGQ